MDLSTLFILLFIGVIAGLASGFVGIGGGLIIVPALIFFTGLDNTPLKALSCYDASSIDTVTMNYHSEQSIEWAYAACLVTFIIVGE